MKVLIIEDTSEIVRTVSLCFQMRWQGATVLSTAEGVTGIQMVRDESPDIVVLDLGLPDMSGFDVLKEVRLFSAVPIVILTVREDELDKVRGLEEGADDYITKPFRPLDLLARVRAVLRRSQTSKTESAIQQPLTFGALSINHATREVLLDGEQVHLTPHEYDLLTHMVRNRDRVLDHQSLLNTVWKSEFIDVTTLKKYVYQLRLKLKDIDDPPRIIVNERGVGYKFVVPR